MTTRFSHGIFAAACGATLLWAATALAQPHGPRPVPVHRPGPPRVAVGLHYGPYYGAYFYNPWFYSSLWWYPPYGYGYPYYYGAVGSNIKVQVEPKSAEVYVDGYLAGIVDQFDGTFQNLVVEPGSREIAIYRDGYKSIVQRLYLGIGSSYKIKGALEKLAPGEPNEPRPAPAPAPAPSQPAYQYEAPPPAGPPAALPAVEAVPPAAGSSSFGQIAIRAQPPDAEITIDGEPWKGPAGADRLVVHLRPGTHRVEIRKEGFEAFVTAVEIRKGEVTALNVSLAR